MSDINAYIKSLECLQDLNDREYRAVAASLLCDMAESLSELGAKSVIPLCFSRIDGQPDEATGLSILPGYAVVDVSGDVPAETWYAMGEVELDRSEYKVTKCC